MRINDSKYKKPSYKEFEQLKRYSSELTKAANFLKENFSGRQIFFCTNEKAINLLFKGSNFMHLCGIKYKKGANSFFNDCLNRTISLNEIAIKKNGTTFQKLGVLSAIPLLLKVNTSLCTRGKYLFVEFEYAIRTRRQIVSLTINREQGKGFFYPESLLDLKQMKNFSVGDRIECIYAIHLQDKTTTLIDIIDGQSLSNYTSL